jgi:hypothetical protein
MTLIISSRPLNANPFGGSSNVDTNFNVRTSVADHLLFTSLPSHPC